MRRRVFYADVGNSLYGTRVPELIEARLTISGWLEDDRRCRKKGLSGAGRSNFVPVHASINAQIYRTS